MPEDKIRRFPDPGGPIQTDRDLVLVKGGASKGKTLRRKPRLQVRLRPGYDVSIVRKALNIALKLKHGALELNLDKIDERPDRNTLNLELIKEINVLKKIISTLAFDPLESGISNIAEALHVLGFAPNDRPNKAAIRVRFRKLAAIHHPDSICGNHQRMTQINAAMEFLCK